jgi:DNA-binding MarR family transcriptional regulator
MEEKRSVGRSIRTIGNIIKRNINSGSYNKQMIDHITGTNGWVIGFIADQNNSGKTVYQKDLEKAFSITRSTVSKVIDLMVQKGLVERFSVEHDARLKKLVLTPKALQLYELMREDGQKLEAIITAGFSKEELDELFHYLERIRRNLDEH